MDEKKVLIFGTFLLVGLMVITFIELTSGGIFNRNAVPPQMTPEMQRALQERIMQQQGNPYMTQPTSCGDVSVDCKVSATARIKHCKADEAEKQISDELAYPLRSETCKQAERALAERCPRGCPLDYSTVTVFGGQLNFRPSPRDDEGFCSYVGEKSVTIKGTCKPGQS
ncbi:MAG: hypothetical protein KDD66_05890 [Bdellovibrionales bacterium]|nr:hypothetical protein [Bdellovibrionales bacterium]